MLLLRRGRAQAEADGHSRTVKTRLSGSAKQTGRHEYEWEDQLITRGNAKSLRGALVWSVLKCCQKSLKR